MRDVERAVEVAVEGAVEAYGAGHCEESTSRTPSEVQTLERLVSGLVTRTEQKSIVPAGMRGQFDGTHDGVMIIRGHESIIKVRSVIKVPRLRTCRQAGQRRRARRRGRRLDDAEILHVRAVGRRAERPLDRERRAGAVGEGR